MITDDMELVRRYTRDDSEEAFATLVSRHINLVYSVALRQLAGSVDPLEAIQRLKSFSVSSPWTRPPTTISSRSASSFT
jgi:hypothetical protein